MCNIQSKELEALFQSQKEKISDSRHTQLLPAAVGKMKMKMPAKTGWTPAQVLYVHVQYRKQKADRRVPLRTRQAARKPRNLPLSPA